MIKLNSFLNDINNSNCYIVQDQESGNCIIVDPGSRDINPVIMFLKNENLTLDYIILTHSHFDHIAGAGTLTSIIPAKIISSKLCSEKIIDPVKNLSYFADYGIISAPRADIFIEDFEMGKFQWNNFDLYIFNTPGHTACSVCIQIEDMIFTGDTLIKGIKTKVTYPDGNKIELRKTLENIYENIPGEVSVFPGHGESFILKTQELSVSLNN